MHSKKHNFSGQLLRRRAKGQTMVVVGMLIATGVLIGLVAIAFDGGSALLQRRVQQNAAEAGALAGVQLMQQNVIGTCQPTPCHPAYTIRNDDVLDQVEALARANRGGTLGATDSNYTVAVEYHYMAGAPACPTPTSPCYLPAPARNPSQFVPVPEYADGLRVTAAIDNPNSGFSKAIPNPIQSLRVSARAAAKLSPSCPVAPGPGTTLPFTRFRPSLERDFWTQGNDLCNPFTFWSSGADISGNSSFKNLISFSTQSEHTNGIPSTGVVTQTLTAFDTRHPPSWLNGNYCSGNNNCSGNEDTRCVPSQLQFCADMRGSPLYGSVQNAQNWIFFNWQGQIAYDSQYPANTETRYQANRSNSWGLGSSTVRLGDWAEVLPTSGTIADSIASALHDFIATDPSHVMTDLSYAPDAQHPTGLNWGPAMVRTVFVWGEPECAPGVHCQNDPGHTYTDPKSIQDWQTGNNVWLDASPPCANNGTIPGAGWEDDSISLNTSNGNFSANAFCGGPANIDRLRFTFAYTFIFYANLVQNSYGALNPPGCSLNLSNSSARGFVTSPPIPGGGGGGTCGWVPGAGVSYGQVDPNGP